MYEYSCEVRRVVDGDTIDVTMDLGFNILHKCRVRLFGIDTPESRTRDLDEKARGILAKNYLKDAIETGKKVVIQTVSIPIPVYISVDYKFIIRTEYQQQMNDLIRPFFTIAGNSPMPKRITAQGHAYEVFIDGSFADNSNQTNLGMEQRNYETIIGIDVLGYLIGEGENQEPPSGVKRQNAVEFKFGREHVVFGDIPVTRKGTGEGWYRED